MQAQFHKYKTTGGSKLIRPLHLQLFINLLPAAQVAQRHDPAEQHARHRPDDPGMLPVLGDEAPGQVHRRGDEPVGRADRALEAVKAGADIEKISVLPVRERIGRAKSAEDYEAEYPAIRAEIDSQCAALTEKN